MTGISGNTKLAGIIGWPLDHTLSPAMHNAVYPELGLDWVYVPLAVQDEIGLRRLVAAVRSLPFVGFNVTMPFKQAMLELCDEVAMTAKMAGAVNAVHCDGDKLVGYNTDGRGLLEALMEDAAFNVAEKKVVLLGAGGAAGAAFVAFILGKAGSVTIVNRNPVRAEELLERLAGSLGATRASVESYASSEKAVREADLIVNATSAGMVLADPSPIPASWLRPGQVVFDMVYGLAEPTALVKEARTAGATALDGLGMLVRQGATCVDIWNSSKQTRTPRETMRDAALDELRRRNTAVQGA